MKFILIILYSLMFFACTSNTNKNTLPKETQASLEPQKHLCGHYTPHLVPTLVFSTNYSIPDQCFNPYVKNEDVAIENQRYILYTKMIGVMIDRPTDMTGSEQLDRCWEHDWKWDWVDESKRPRLGRMDCNVGTKVKREYVETVKKMERCRLECLKKGEDPFESIHEIDFFN